MVEAANNSDKPVSTKIYKEWDTQDVSLWLKDQLKLPQYCETFCKWPPVQDYRTLTQFFCCAEDLGIKGDILDDLNDDDLKTDFGIGPRIHRVMILNGI